jgi:hypothetical protein
MKKEFEFVGFNSGDGDSFCFEVDKETFIKVTGRQPDAFDYVNGDWDENENFIPDKKSLLRLYPDDLFGYLGKMVKIKLIVEEID